MAKVTMRSLGRQLGVSAVTVSKALAGKSGVSEEMRQRIVALAKEVGYVNPNAAPEKPGLDVGILIPAHFFAPDSYYAMLCKELVQRLTDAGHFGLLELCTRDMQWDMLLPNLLRSRRVDALILLGQPDRAYAELLTKQPLPVICMDFGDSTLHADAVVGDSTGGMAALTRHLIDCGHREIAFYGTVQATSSIMERYLGYASAMLAAGLPIRPEHLLPDRDAGDNLLPLSLPENRPTALVCNCDRSARWVISQLKQQGLHVPEDVSIVGFDDFSLVPSEASDLTTYRVNREEMCASVVRMLEARCAGDERPVCRITVGGACVYRDSVRCVPNNSDKVR